MILLLPNSFLNESVTLYEISGGTSDNSATCDKNRPLDEILLLENWTIVVSQHWSVCHLTEYGSNIQRKTASLSILACVWLCSKVKAGTRYRSDGKRSFISYAYSICSLLKHLLNNVTKQKRSNFLNKIIKKVLGKPRPWLKSFLEWDLWSVH